MKNDRNVPTVVIQDTIARTMTVITIMIMTTITTIPTLIITAVPHDK